MTLSDFLLLSIAVFGFTEWTRHDHRVQNLFAYLEQTRFKLLSTVYQCGFCWSHWTTIFVVLCWYLVPYSSWLFTGFAIRAVANVVSDLSCYFSRTPNRKKTNDVESNENSGDSDLTGQ